MPISVYAANALCAQATSVDLWVAFLLSYPDPNDTGSTLVEPTATGYARHPLDHTYWSAPSAGEATWNFDITILPEANWGTINSYALCDAATAGEIVGYAYLSAPLSIDAGSNMNVPSGMLTFRVQ